MRRFSVYCIILVCGVMWSNLMFAQAQISCPPPKDCKNPIVLAKKAFAAQTDCFERFDCIPQKNCDDCIMHMKWKTEINSKDALCDETEDIIPDSSTLEALVHVEPRLAPMKENS